MLCSGHTELLFILLNAPGLLVHSSLGWLQFILQSQLSLYFPEEALPDFPRLAQGAPLLEPFVSYSIRAPAPGANLVWLHL